jgi:hypothetical protein
LHRVSKDGVATLLQRPGGLVLRDASLRDAPQYAMLLSMRPGENAPGGDGTRSCVMQP